MRQVIRRQRRIRAWAGVSRVPLDLPVQREESLAMNRPWPIACYARRTSWTSGCHGESPIGACGDDFVIVRCDNERRLVTQQGGLVRAQAFGRRSIGAGPTGQEASLRRQRPRRPEVFKKGISRRPRRWCLDFSLLIGGTPPPLGMPPALKVLALSAMSPEESAPRLNLTSRSSLSYSYFSSKLVPLVALFWR